MYNPSNGFVNVLMRWPLVGSAAAGIAAINTDGVASIAASFVAGGLAGVYGLMKVKPVKDHICDCEDDGYMKLSDAKLEWIVEFNPETGEKRPWDVYTMFGGLEFTKQHYASYATEENALNKIKQLRDNIKKD